MIRNGPPAGALRATALHERTLVLDDADCACGLVPDERSTVKAGGVAVTIYDLDHQPTCPGQNDPTVTGLRLSTRSGPGHPVIAWTASKALHEFLLHWLGPAAPTNRRVIENATNVAEALADPHAWANGHPEALGYLAAYAADHDHASDEAHEIAMAGFANMRDYAAWRHYLNHQQCLDWRPLCKNPLPVPALLDYGITPDQYEQWVKATEMPCPIPADVIWHAHRTGWEASNAASVALAVGANGWRLGLMDVSAINATLTRFAGSDHETVGRAMEAGFTLDEIETGLLDGTLTREGAAVLAALSRR